MSAPPSASAPSDAHAHHAMTWCATRCSTHSQPAAKHSNQPRQRHHAPGTDAHAKAAAPRSSQAHSAHTAQPYAAREQAGHDARRWSEAQPSLSGSTAPGCTNATTGAANYVASQWTETQRGQQTAWPPLSTTSCHSHAAAPTRTTTCNSPTSAATQPRATESPPDFF